MRGNKPADRLDVLIGHLQFRRIDAQLTKYAPDFDKNLAHTVPERFNRDMEHPGMVRRFGKHEPQPPDCNRTAKMRADPVGLPAHMVEDKHPGIVKMRKRKRGPERNRLRGKKLDAARRHCLQPDDPHLLKKIYLVRAKNPFFLECYLPQ